PRISMLTGLRVDRYDAGIAASDHAKSIGDTEGAADAAKEAMEPYRKKLQELADQGYLTQDQVDALTGELLGVPEITSFLISDGDSITRSEKKILELTGQIMSVPDKTVTIDEPLSKGTIKRLRELGDTVKELPDGKIKITSTGETTVESVLNELTKDRTVTIRAHFDKVNEGMTRNLPGVFAGSGSGKSAKEQAPGVYKP